MEGVSIVWGAEIHVTSGGLGAYYYSLMTAFGRSRPCIKHCAWRIPVECGMKQSLSKNIGID